MYLIFKYDVSGVRVLELGATAANSRYFVGGFLSKPLNSYLTAAVGSGSRVTASMFPCPPVNFSTLLYLVCGQLRQTAKLRQAHS